MDFVTIKKIIKINEDFYNNNAESFSKTRQHTNDGWLRLVPIIDNVFQKSKAISVLDIGCGNGRFYKFLKNSYKKKFDYLGIDNNNYLLIESLLKYPETTFKKTNIFIELSQIRSLFDLVVAFGITHHIPGSDFRKMWFQSLIDLLKPGGILILTFWNIGEDKRFIKAKKLSYFEDKDYLYGWKNSKDMRYVHIYDRNEVKIITQIFKKNNLKLINSFDSDGKNNKMNSYLVLQKATSSQQS